MIASRPTEHTNGHTRARALLVQHRGWSGIFLIGALGSAFYAFPYTVDDAFISARYAQHLAQGIGYRFNPNVASDGVTGPLWLVPLTLAARLGISPLFASKVLGLGCALVACWLVLERVRARAGAAMRLPLSGLLLASASPLWIWAVGGLESGVAALVCTVMLYAALAGRGLCVGGCAASLVWLRPELMPLALLSLTWQLRKSRRQAFWAGLLSAVSLLGVLLFRKLMFDHFLPLSAAAKPALLSHGATYVWDCLRAPATLALVVGAAVLTRMRARSEERLILLALVVHGAAVLLAGGDWMPRARLFVPLVPVACALMANGFARMIRLRRRIGLLCFSAALCVRVVSGWSDLHGARASGLLRAARLPSLLAALRAVDGPIALIDVGAVAYFGGHTVIDLAGLTDPDVAFQRGGHLAKQLPADWLDARAPAAIVLHSRERPRVDERGRVRWFAGYPVERRVLSLPSVQTQYRVANVVPYDRDYFYLILTRQSQNEGSVKREPDGAQRSVR